VAATLGASPAVRASNTKAVDAVREMQQADVQRGKSRGQVGKVVRMRKLIQKAFKASKK
jgi:hypothetical protein